MSDALRRLTSAVILLISSFSAVPACDDLEEMGRWESPDTLDDAPDVAPDSAPAPDATDEIGADAPDDLAPADVADTDPTVDTTPPPRHPALIGTELGAFTVRPGVEIATVFDAAPNTPMTLYDAEGNPLLTVIADDFGQAHFAYIPATHETLDPTVGISGELVRDGHVLFPGDGYVVRDDTATPPRAVGPFRVLALSDHPDASFYDDAPIMTGVHYGILGHDANEDPQAGLNYIRTRDGTLLSAMVRFPDPTLWGDGPWPTVVEYSGYAPSDPSSPDPGSRIATLLGYVSVGVNMRGSGCSGGVFDIFSPAQQADGYDIIETVARQPFVLGNKVGMVGLSYPGISQLYVAATRPPSLAAITPLSVLADPWVELRPGGIYNDGFTRQWLEQRDAEAAPDGQSWTERRIAWGDPTCDAHQDLRNQNLKFEDIFKALEFYPDDAAARSLPLLVPRIDVPVYLTGAFQDEQTGPQFTEMLGRFTAAPVARFVLYNGRHPDGYSPLALARWYEFLELYVAQRVPRLPEWIRTIGSSEFSKEFDSTDLAFEPDRFTDFSDDDYTGVRAAYEAEPAVHVLFDSGGDPAQPGAPRAAFATDFEAWPPDSDTKVLFLAPGGALTDDAPLDAAAEVFAHDPDAGDKTFFGPRGYEVMARLWDIRWTRFPAGTELAYETAPLTEDLVLGGPSFAELFVSSDAADVNLQVTLTEVRPDGQEALLTTGWLRIGHTAIDPEFTVGNHIAYTFLEEDFVPLAPDETRMTRVPIPSIAHALRAGSRLRLLVSSPGRNHGTWQFTAPDYDAIPTHRVALGGATASSLHLSVLPGFSVPTALPACPGLRGQPCRAYEPTTNRSAD